VWTSRTVLPSSEELEEGGIDRIESLATVSNWPTEPSQHEGSGTKLG